MAEQIKDLGKGGLNTDLAPVIVPMNTFTDVMNVRFDDDYAFCADDELMLFCYQHEHNDYVRH